MNYILQKKIERFRLAEAMLWLIQREYLQNDVKKIENMIMMYDYDSIVDSIDRFIEKDIILCQLLMIGIQNEWLDREWDTNKPLE
jgi:hypothetical protein